MNQNVEEIKIRDLMNGDDGHGRSQGEILLNKLMPPIQKSKALIIRFSLQGINRLDASFPRESIMEVSRSLKGEKGFCLTEVSNIDLVDNLDAAALKKKVSMLIWSGEEYQIIGIEPKKGLSEVISYVLKKEVTTAAEVAKTMDLKLNNASMKLKQLVTEGFLIRQEEIAPSGGKEFYYYRIK